MPHDAMPGPGGSGPPLPVLAWHWGREGAGAKFTLALVRELHRHRGLAVEICAAEGSELATGVPSEPGLTLHRIRTFRGDKGRVAGKLAAAAGLLRLPRIGRDFAARLEARPGTLALCTFQSIWDAGAIPVLTRRPGRFLLVLHDALFHPGDSYPFRTAVLRRQVAAADGLIVLSDHVGREAVRHHAFPADRIWTVPHGAFDFGVPSQPRTLPVDRPVRLLFLGRILPYKGLGLLLDAFARLRGRGVAVELSVVGAGSLAEHSGALDRLSGITIDNRWIGEDEIGAALARSDVVVLPYVEASQSGIAAAAMTAGLPIVATPVGGLSEQVAHGRTGLVSAGVTAGDLAASIETLCRDPDLYAACSAGAIARARAEMGWDRIGGTVAAIAHEVAKRPRRHAATEHPPSPARGDRCEIPAGGAGGRTGA